MKDLPDPRELDQAVANMRVAVLTASFRKLRYRHEPGEVAAMLAEWKSNREIFDAVESKQGLITRMAIGWRKLRRGKSNGGY
jgi:hypothetical protein